jgi:hypothetical protein
MFVLAQHEEAAATDALRELAQGGVVIVGLFFIPLILSCASVPPWKW